MDYSTTKKSHARVLATLAQGSSEGGMTSAQFPELIEMDYNKKCSIDVAEEILWKLQRFGKAYRDDNGLWHASDAGKKLIADIRLHRSSLLDKTTTPNQMMHA